MGKTTEEKAAELRAEARRHREENYEVKRGADFTCEEPGCNERHQLLVVEVTQGAGEDEPPELEARCRQHVGELPIRPFQFNESQPPPIAA